MAPVPFKKISLAKLKEKRRDVEEERLRKRDAERQRRRKEKDLPDMIMQVNKMNDPDAVRRHMRMVFFRNFYIFR